VPEVRQQEDPARLYANAVVSAIVWHLQPFVRSLQLVIQWIRLTGQMGEARNSPSLVSCVSGLAAGHVRVIPEKILSRLPPVSSELRFGYE
jgi:hypothetical protein